MARPVPLWRLVLALIALGALVVLTGPLFGWAGRKALGR